MSDFHFRDYFRRAALSLPVQALLRLCMVAVVGASCLTCAGQSMLQPLPTPSAEDTKSDSDEATGGSTTQEPASLGISFGVTVP